MKTLIIILLLVLGTTVSQAQHVTHLDEVKVVKTALKSKFIKGNNEIIIKIENANVLEFTKNPIAFMYNHFDVQNFISELDLDKFDRYVVTLKSKDGYMVAKFDSDGELLNTRQSFKNILLPYDMRIELYKSYKGWTMTKNKYNATTKGEILNKEIYRISFRKGNQKQNVKINSNNDGVMVVSN
ncbi:hypothetical protein [Gelidibacter sp. F63206]|uniref:hypothetical protein n=1 Tax=Gelidibacter sp. F63206 TaxID=2926425 RepID=UPI001FF1BD49|nr:hypothetical protein [Gelidibacter sp. F63206]MCK0114692.1 hypothetical protein [Gelidibacter sp. F63206]